MATAFEKIGSNRSTPPKGVQDQLNFGLVDPNEFREAGGPSRGPKRKNLREHYKRQIAFHRSFSMNSTNDWRWTDGRWSLSMHVLKVICRSTSISDAERFFILSTLGVENQLRQHWDHSEFRKNIGMTDTAGHTTDKTRDGWRASLGDLAWSAGDTTAALKRYQEAVDEGEPAGSSGKFRLHFANGHFSDAIAAFQESCPPHDYYVQRQEKMSAIREGRAAPSLLDFNALVARYPGKSTCFLPNSTYMCKAVIIAAIQSGGIDEPLSQMLCDYFGLKTIDLDTLKRSLKNNAKETQQLQRRITPKRTGSGRSFANLKESGATKRAKEIVDRIPRSTEFRDSAKRSLNEFLKSGSKNTLDDAMTSCMPFGIPELDEIITSDVISSCRELLEAMPERRLSISRRLGSANRLIWRLFETDLLDVLWREPRSIGATDIVNAILDQPWHNSPFNSVYTDRTSLGGLTKSQLEAHREWLEIRLEKDVGRFEFALCNDRRAAIMVLFEAYKHLSSSYDEHRSGERWLSEAALFSALSALFGEAETQRHASPIWLSPQHLDIFVPKHCLAIEYMGIQHYEPVDIFGGDGGLATTTERDHRKAQLCERMGITL